MRCTSRVTTLYTAFAEAFAGTLCRYAAYVPTTYSDELGISRAHEVAVVQSAVVT